MGILNRKMKPETPQQFAKREFREFKKELFSNYNLEKARKDHEETEEI